MGPAPPRKRGAEARCLPRIRDGHSRCVSMTEMPNSDDALLRHDPCSTPDAEFPNVRTGNDAPLLSLPPQVKHLNRYHCNADVYTLLSDGQSRETGNLNRRSHTAFNTSRVPNKLPTSPPRIAASKKVDYCSFLCPQG